MFANVQFVRCLNNSTPKKLYQQLYGHTNIRLPGTVLLITFGPLIKEKHECNSRKFT